MLCVWLAVVTLTSRKTLTSIWADPSAIRRVKVRRCALALAGRDAPDGRDLEAGLGARVEAAVADGVADGQVAVQRDGAQVHDGRRGEQHVQVDPRGTQLRGQRPAVICATDIARSNAPETVGIWTLNQPPS